MQKLIKNKNLLFSIILLFFAVLFIASFIPAMSLSTSHAAGVSTPLQTNKDFTVRVVDRQTNAESTLYKKENLTIGTAFIYQWADVNAFEFKYDSTKGIAPAPRYEIPDDTESRQYYDISLSIEYLQGYKNVAGFGGTGLIFYSNAFETKVFDDLGDLPNTFSFNIDDGKIFQVGEEHETKKIQGWGIYKFYLQINDTLIESDYFVVEPQKKIFDSPELKLTSKNSSENSLRYDYTFTVKNSEDYAYIDTSKLVWYVTGTAKDGTAYVLSKEDTYIEGYGNHAYLFETYERKNRTGLEFTFRDPKQEGSWQVWCEYNYHESTERALTSKKISIKTGTQYDLTTIIIVAVIGFVLSIVVAIILGYLRIRKDKVY